MILDNLKYETIIGMCVVALTKHIMQKFNLSQEVAFAKLATTKFYSLLENPDTGLCLEPDYYLFKCCDLELDDKPDEMLAFIENN